MLEYPALLDSDHVNDVFPSDAIARARTLLEHNPSGVGTAGDFVFVLFPSVSFLSPRWLVPFPPPPLFPTSNSPLDSSALGAYTHSKGVAYIRQRIAEHIEARDGHPSHFKNIFITDGASPAVKTVLNAAIRDKSDGVMIPMPQVCVGRLL